MPKAKTSAPAEKKTTKKKSTAKSVFGIDASYVSLTGKAVEFKVRDFAPISEITIVCEDVAQAVVTDDGYHPYLKEFLIWTGLVRLYTDLNIDKMIDKDADSWFKELNQTNLKETVKSFIPAGQYNLIFDSVNELIEYKKENRKTALDTLIDAFIGDGILFDLMDKLVPTENEIAEGVEEDVQLS